MASLAEVLAVARVSRNQFNDWGGLARRPKILRTRYARTEAGIARRLTRENALELAFVGALVRGGLGPADATRLATLWLADLAAKKLAPFFALNPLTGEGLAYSDERLGILDFREVLGEAEGGWGDDHDGRSEPATEIYLIDRAAIVARIEGALGE